MFWTDFVDTCLSHRITMRYPWRLPPMSPSMSSASRQTFRTLELWLSTKPLLIASQKPTASPNEQSKLWKTRFRQRQRMLVDVRITVIAPTETGHSISTMGTCQMKTAPRKSNSVGRGGDITASRNHRRNRPRLRVLVVPIWAQTKQEWPRLLVTECSELCCPWGRRCPQGARFPEYGYWNTHTQET